MFPIPGDVIPRDSESFGFSVEYNTCWVLGSLTLKGEGLHEGGVRTTCWKEKKVVFLSTYLSALTVTGTLPSTLHATLH